MTTASKIAPVPDFVPTVVFTDIDGDKLTVRPISDPGGYYVNITVDGTAAWLSARDALELARVLEATAVAVGAAAVLADLPLLSADDESRPAFTLE